MRIFAAFILLTIANVCLADKGYTFKGDLNNDGVEDSIMSGPSNLFGNAGGPFLIFLSQKDGTHKTKLVAFHPRAIALEINDLGSNRLWGYWKLGGQNGTLFNVSLDDNFVEQSITINSGMDATELSQNVYKTIFDKKFLITLKELENYVPPEYHWGK